MKLFVRNINFRATPADLQVFMSSRGYGPTEVKILTNPEDGRSRGFGFVTFTNVSSYEAALRELEGEEFMGRELLVEPARDKPKGQQRKSGYDRSGGPRQGHRPEGHRPEGHRPFTWEDVW